MFKVGDSICYFRSKEKNQEPFQGLVLEVKGRINNGVSELDEKPKFF
jgi:hypothetical protein